MELRLLLPVILFKHRKRWKRQCWNHDVATRPRNVMIKRDAALKKTECHQRGRITDRNHLGLERKYSVKTKNNDGILNR